MPWKHVHVQCHVKCACKYVQAREPKARPLGRLALKIHTRLQCATHKMVSNYYWNVHAYMYMYMYVHTYMYMYLPLSSLFCHCSAPPLTVPSGGYFLSVFRDSFAIAIVTYTITVSLGQVLARRFDYDIHSNQVSCNAYLCP